MENITLNKKIRIKCYKNILKHIEKKYAIKIEASIYKFSKKYATDNNTPFLVESIYESKYNDIISLFIKKKELLKKALYNKKIKPREIAFFKPEELLPDAFENLLKKINDKNNIQQGTTLYVCSKCKQKNSKVETKQMRAADEPPTVIVTCLECGNVEILD